LNHCTWHAEIQLCQGCEFFFKADFELCCVQRAPAYKTTAQRPNHPPHEPAEDETRARQETIGLSWEEIGPATPETGKEIENLRLSRALQTKHDFSRDEFDKFGILNLSDKSYIKVGQNYFRPAVQEENGSCSDDLVLEIFDGVVPELDVRESRLWADVWGRRKACQENRDTMFNWWQTVLADTGKKMISGAQRRVEKARITALACVTRCDDARDAVERAKSILELESKTLEPAVVAKEMTLEVLGRVQKVCQESARLKDKLQRIEAKDTVENRHVSLVCPIGKSVMRDPVVAADGMNVIRMCIYLIHEYKYLYTYMYIYIHVYICIFLFMNI